MTEPMQQSESEEIRDFTIKRVPIQFRIDGDVFRAPAVISPITLKKIAALHANMGDIGAAVMDSDAIEHLIGKIGDMFKILLPGDSGVLFASRLASETEPIGLTDQALPALYYLLERYGLRPTQPSLSSPGMGTDGDSTDGARVEESIPTPSPFDAF